MKVASSLEERLFKCKCNAFQIKLIGDPVLDSTCHCHCCVTCCEHVNTKYHGNGTTPFQDHGAALSMFRSSQVEFLATKLTSDMFGYVKIGPEGKLIRLYTKCCGTMIGFVHPKFVALNRNAIYNQDGSLYVPVNPPHNVHKKSAFDPSVVPEPSYNTIPFMLYVKLFPVIINPFGNESRLKDKALFPKLDQAEIEENTWD